MLFWSSKDMLYTAQTAHRRKPVLCGGSALGGEMEKQNIMMVWLLSVLALLLSQGELSQLQSVLGLLGSSSSRELEKHGSPPTSSTQLCTGGPWTLFKVIRPVFHSQVLHLKGWGCLRFEYLCMDFQAVIMIMMCVWFPLFWIHLIYSTPDNGFRSHSDRTVQASNGVFWENQLASPEGVGALHDEY